MAAIRYILKRFSVSVVTLIIPCVGFDPSLALVSLSVPTGVPFSSKLTLVMTLDSSMAA